MGEGVDHWLHEINQRVNDMGDFDIESVLQCIEDVCNEEETHEAPLLQSFDIDAHQKDAHQEGSSSQDPGVITQENAHKEDGKPMDTDREASKNEFHKGQETSIKVAHQERSSSQDPVVLTQENAHKDGKPMDTNCEAAKNEFHKGQEVYLLAIDDDHKVGVGRVVNINANDRCHFTLIGDGNVSVEVSESLEDNYQLPLSHPDADTIKEALKSVVRWPTRSLVSVLDEEDAHQNTVSSEAGSDQEEPDHSSKVKSLWI